MPGVFAGGAGYQRRFHAVLGNINSVIKSANHKVNIGITAIKTIKTRDQPFGRHRGDKTPKTMRLLKEPETIPLMALLMTLNDESADS